MENPNFRASNLQIETEENEPSALNNNYNNADDPDLKCENFDEILDLVGSKGKFQKLLLYAVISPITLIQPFIFMNVIFLLYQPDHWCHIPGRDNLTNLETWKSHHIPLDLQRLVGPDAKYSRCTMFTPNGSIVECQMGWEYDRRDYTSTIPSAFNWVCDKADYPTYSFTVQALGNAVGTIVFGSLADKWGRKPVFFSTIFINVVFRLLSLHLVEYHVAFLAMQFLIGTAFPAMFITPTMIAAEVSHKDHRGIIQSVIWINWVIGMAILPFVVWICKEWYIIGLVTTLPGIGILMYWFTMPESPRWLFSVGRLEESAKILLEIAECNGTSYNLTKPQLEKSLQQIFTKQDKNDGTVGVWTLFSRFRLARNTLLLTICWSINIIVYYAITFNSIRLATGNQFINFSLIAIIEIPSGLVFAYLVGKFGRRWIQTFFFCFSAFACILTALVVNYSNEPYLEIVFVIIAKFTVTVTYLIVYLQGTEIFPTALRSTGSGFASTIGGALGMLSPIIVALGTYNISYPYWIMGILSIMGMVCAAFIPETLNQIPETIEDANNLKLHKFWSLYPYSKPKSESVALSDNPEYNNCINNSES